MPSLLEYLADMEAAAERTSAEGSAASRLAFGLRPLTAFPFAAAEAYADVRPTPALPGTPADLYAHVSAWAFLRKRYRPSKSFARKERLVNGYVRAWQAYVEALLDVHIRYWLDMPIDEKAESRIREQHRIQRVLVDKAFAVPTPVQANSIDRIRNAGSKRAGLARIWHAERWTENPEAEAIVMAEMGYSST